MPTRDAAARVNLGGVAETIWICMNELAFNGGPGRVSVDAAATIDAAQRGQPWQVYLEFLGGGERSPAWHYIPSLNLPTLTSLRDYEVGFIQTVESLQLTLQYEGLLSLIARAANLRDAVDARVPAPWFGRAAPVGPTNLATTEPMTELQDTPRVPARAFGSSARAERPLQRVQSAGSFHWWLVIKQIGTSGPLQFLYHASIQFDRSWLYQPAAQNPSPAEPTQYRATGSQTYLRSGIGRGPIAPVLTGRLANDVLHEQVTRFHFG